MTNGYFSSYTPLPRHQNARAEAVNAIFDAVIVGFDGVPAAAAIQQDRVTHCTDTGAADAYVIAPATAILSYVAGQHFTFVALHANTMASTVNVSTLGVKTIKRQDGTDLSAGDIALGQVVDIRYDGTYFQLMSVPSGTVAAAATSATAAAASATAAAASASSASASASSASSSATAAAASAATLTAGQFPGTATNDSAGAGKVGQYISATLLIASAVSLSSNTPADVTSISLTAGDWDVWGTVAYAGTFTGATHINAWISATSATTPTIPNGGAYFNDSSGAGATADVKSVGQMRVSIASTTTIYLSTNVIFSGSATVYGFLGARRAR